MGAKERPYAAFGLFCYSAHNLSGMRTTYPSGHDSRRPPAGGRAADGRAVSEPGKGVNKMTKADLIDQVAARSGLTKKAAGQAVDALFESVTEALAAGQRVQIVGFGTFEVRERAARRGRNPQTGQEIEISARKVPAFKAGKALKDAVGR